MCTTPAPRSEDGSGPHPCCVPAPFPALHAALRADADRLTLVADAVARGDGARVAAFVDRTSVFVAGVHCHNAIVGELVVPEVLRRRPDAGPVVAVLEAQHAELDTLAHRVQDRTIVLDTAVRGWQVSALAVAEDLAALRDALEAHLEREEREFGPLWHAALAPEDEAALTAAVLEHTADTLPLLVAWIEHAAGPAAAATVLRDAPAALREACRAEWCPAFARRAAATL